MSHLLPPHPPPILHLIMVHVLAPIVHPHLQLKLVNQSSFKVPLIIFGMKLRNSILLMMLNGQWPLLTHLYAFKSILGNKRKTLSPLEMKPWTGEIPLTPEASNRKYVIYGLTTHIVDLHPETYMPLVLLQWAKLTLLHVQQQFHALLRGCNSFEEIFL